MPVSITEAGEQVRALTAPTISIGMDLAAPPQKTLDSFRQAAFKAIYLPPKEVSGYAA